MDKFFNDYCLSANTATTLEKLSGTDCTPSSQVRVTHSLVQWNPSIPDTLGAAYSVLIKGGVLISGLVLSLCSWDHAWCPD